ncbi:MAG: hypothetical protein M0P66_06230 [Salinivirgaceae bacterium]|nr:hypothetical protein [Salinivirgaceae bacterium]
MAPSKKPKWDLEEAIAAGEKALALSDKYSDQLGGRISKTELETFSNNVTNLKKFPIEGTQQLVEQKSKTAGKESSLARLKKLVGSIRKLVKNHPTVTPEISKAYGVGAHLGNSTSHQLAAGKLIIEAYGKYNEWSTRVGIIAADITTIEAFIAEFDTKAKEQTDAKKTKKDTTFEKNNLQRMVEDEVTRFSALGVIVFGAADPIVAKLFEDLIPAHTPPTGNGTDTAPEGDAT